MHGRAISLLLQFVLIHYKRKLVYCPSFTLSLDMFVLSRNSASELHLLHILWDAVFETILLCMEIVECYEY